MLAAMYVGYVILIAKLKPAYMPQLPEHERAVSLPPHAQVLARRGSNVLAVLWRTLRGGAEGIARKTLLAQLVVALLPALAVVVALGLIYRSVTAPMAVLDTAGVLQVGGLAGAFEEESPAELSTGLETPPVEEGDIPAEAAAPVEVAAEPAPETGTGEAVAKAKAVVQQMRSVPLWFWITLAVAVLWLVVRYWRLNWERLEIFKMLLASFFPLTILILAVLGSIVFGFATPTEAAGVGAFGGFVLTVAYRLVGNWRDLVPNGGRYVTVLRRTTKEVAVIVKESSFLTAKTSAMVCWLFVGSGIFSAAFALLGGQEIVERWVLSLDMTPIQFMILAQIIIFLLGWPLEWTEIIIIFMPIFIPLLTHFGIDPLFFGLLVALNLQTAFLSPPVAMAAYYLKGVAPPHVTLMQIFTGMMPYMGIQIIAMVLLYTFPAIGLWLPGALYK